MASVMAFGDKSMQSRRMDIAKGGTFTIPVLDK